MSPKACCPLPVYEKLNKYVNEVAMKDDFYAKVRNNFKLHNVGNNGRMQSHK